MEMEAARQGRPGAHAAVRRGVPPRSEIGTIYREVEQQLQTIAKTVLR
jgi:hypothetical protein